MRRHCSLQVWFKNRRAKWRKQRREVVSSLDNNNSSSMTSSRHHHHHHHYDADDVMVSASSHHARDVAPAAGRATSDPAAADRSARERQSHSDARRLHAPMNNDRTVTTGDRRPADKLTLLQSLASNDCFVGLACHSSDIP